MEALYLPIKERVAAEMPDLALIDEDYGQLQALLNGDDSYPLLFPCVLIGDAVNRWTDIGAGLQKSSSRVTVRLAIDCYHDTHHGSGTEEKILERVEMNQKLFKALHGYRTDRHKMAGGLIRVESRDYGLPRGIKVYETIYEFNYHDDSAVR